MILRKNYYGWLLGIIVLTVALYLPSVQYLFFSWDDDGHLIDNRHIQSLSLSNIQSIFTSQVNQTYIPLTILSFAIEYHFFGLNPKVYHSSNLILHILSVLLVYAFVLRMGAVPLIAAIAAMVFAIHPMHIEPVIWITQRKDVLYTVFYLAGLISYIDYLKDKKIKSYLWVLCCGLLSVLAKPMALSFPLILFLIDRWFDRRISLRAIIEKIPIIMVVASIAWVTYVMNMRSFELHFPQSLLTWMWCLWFYIAKFFYPYDLLVLYQLPKPVSFANSEFYWALTGFVVLIGVVYKFRAVKWVWFAFVYYVCSIFFLLRWDELKDLTFVADRFMYLPSLGFSMAIGYATHRLLEKCPKLKLLRYALIAGAVIIFGLVYKTSMNRVNDWKSEERLWKQVADRYSSAVALTQLGNFYLNAQKENEAIDYYQKAIAVNAKYSKPYSNYAKTLMAQGRWNEALKLLSTAIELEEKPSAVLLTNRGYAFMRLGINQEALTDFNTAIDTDQFYVSAYLNRATVYKNLLMYEASLKDLQRVLEIDRNNIPANQNIQILYGLMNNNK